MTTAAIRTRGLTHRYGRVVALEQVDLTVAPGEIYGFLGRNGAGKTTLIRALLGLITPASGEVTVLGTSIRGARTPARLWARVGGIEAQVDECSVVSSAAEAVEQPDRMATRLVTAGIAPCYLAVEREDLEQRFLRLTGTGQP